jgi:lipooligosaccharide transport system ATP-binding protein|nr:MAG: daunorubicin resistance protein DrrA family ABC transporter ATP-binding protein [Bacteroidota bacterium]
MEVRAQWAIEAEEVSKRYGDLRAVDGVSLRLAPGSCLAVLGPNGAGKTTLVRLLYGFLRPDSGSIRYFGLPFEHHRETIKGWIGVVTQDETLDPDFSVEENLEIYARYFRLRSAQVRKRIAELLARFGLEEKRRALPIALSGGLKRRLQIARALVHRPRVLFLDEPTTGLDPQARLGLWELVHEMRNEGLAIVLTTHYMDEAQRLADWIVLMDRGRVLVEGTVQELLRRHFTGYILELPDEPRTRAALDGWPTRSFLDRLWVEMPLEAASALLGRLEERSYVLRPPNLEDLFLKLTGTALRQ